MAAEDLVQLLRTDLPHLHGAIAAGAGQQSAVGAEDGLDEDRVGELRQVAVQVRVQGCVFLGTCRQIPEFNRAVVRLEAKRQPSG